MSVKRTSKHTDIRFLDKLRPFCDIAAFLQYFVNKSMALLFGNSTLVWPRMLIS